MVQYLILRTNFNWSLKLSAELNKGLIVNYTISEYK